MTPLNREILRAELTRDEGLRLKVYRCTAGKLTIGVGRNLDDVGIFKHETDSLKITKASCIEKGITNAQAMALLDSDIDRCMVDLDKRLPWWRKLDEVRQRVLVNMCFNLGISGLCGFKNTLRYIETGDYERAASNMLLSKWAKQVGKRANRLSELMRLGPRDLSKPAPPKVAPVAPPEPPTPPKAPNPVPEEASTDTTVLGLLKSIYRALQKKNT